MAEFSTRAIHAGQPPDPTTGATIPPISLSSTFTQHAPGEHKGYEYARSGNPTRTALEQALASVEGGEACAAFASGLAATTTILMSLKPGDGVVAGHDLYGGTYRLLERVMKPWGLEVAYAADGSRSAYDAAIATLAKPRLLWVETPTNPLLDLVEIEGLVSLGRRHSMTTVVDNTFASPYLQQPLRLGADLVLHSTTKYIGGHSDLIGGAVISRRTDQLSDIRFLQNALGGVPGPMDCYLALRGLKTLAVRMEQHCRNAMALARALDGRPGIRRVLYPGLPSHPHHELARSQMAGFGGMVSLILEGDFERTKRFCSALKVFALAESLGGVESLCCHPATMTHASIPREVREARGFTDTLVRLSVGIEGADDLIADVEQALQS